MRGKFQATIIVVFVGTLALLMSGCGQDDVETTVRKGALQLDPSITVEDALQGYQYFRRSSWKTFNLHLSGLQLSGPHREIGQPIQQHLPDDDYSMIRSVYSNQPLEIVWAFLYPAASE